MLPHERDFFISRITSGYLRLKHDGVTYKFQLNKDTMYESEEIFYDTYNRCSNVELCDDYTIYKFLIAKGLWTEEKEDILTNKIPKYIENAKVRMYELIDKPEEVEQARLYLDRATEELYSLFEIRHQFDYLSPLGIALYARWQYLVQNCVSLPNGGEIDWNRVHLHDLLNIINGSTISDKNIRELSRNEPWATMWAISKKTSNIFDVAVANYTDEQNRLVRWSILYDNVREREDAPSQEVIDDDDCFDGWMILKNRNDKVESNRERLEKKIGKNAHAQEVFIPVKCQNSPDKNNPMVTLEDASDIFSLNNPMSNYIINSRLNDISRLKPGEKLKVIELTDVRANINMEINRIEANKGT